MTALDAARARRLAWVAVGAYLIGLGISAVLRTQGDFNVYYRTGSRLLAGNPIYLPGESSNFVYAPVFAIWFAPFAALPRGLAQLAWFLVSAAALTALIRGSAVMLFGRERPLSATLILVPIVLSFRSIGNNIEHGQANLPVLALIVWAIVLARRDKPLSAGAMLAAAILIKPFALLAALYLALRRRFGVLGWTAAATAILLVLPVAVFGPRGWIEVNLSYLRTVASMTGRYRMMLTNQSAVSAFARLLGPPAGTSAVGSADAMAMMLGMGLEAVLVAAVSVWILRTEAHGAGGVRRDRLALCGLFCLMPSLAPISWKSYYAALFVPYMALVSSLWIESDFAPKHKARTAGWMLLALSFVPSLLFGRYLRRVGFFYSAWFLGSLTVLGALVAVAVAEHSRSSGRHAAVGEAAGEQG